MKFLACGLGVALIAVSCDGQDDSSRDPNSTTWSAEAGGNTAKGNVIFVVRNTTNGNPIADAEFCLDQADTCQSTNTDGSVSVPYVGNEALRASIRSPGFVTARVNIYPEQATIPEFTVPMVLEGILALLVSNAGVDIDETKGHIAFIASTGYRPLDGQAGISLSFTPNPGGTGVLYFKEGDITQLIAGDAYDRRAEATSSAGAANLYNVDPGRYSLSLSGADGCETFLGLLNDDDSIDFDIKAGEVTYINLNCPDTNAP